MEVSTDALARWREAAEYYEREIKHLRNGLREGYSAPKRVVVRVIPNQMTMFVELVPMIIVFVTMLVMKMGMLFFVLFDLMFVEFGFLFLG